MRLWLDARRQPEVTWAWARTVPAAIALLRGGCVDTISFAPDQRDLVAPVVDWMIDNGVHPERRKVHGRGDGVKTPLIVIRMPKWVEVRHEDCPVPADR